MNTEESFVLASLKEFVKLWGSSREATFNLECRNGQAWFQLGASLGPPSFPHFCPSPNTPKRTKKSTARIEKDPARAAVHRAQKPAKFNLHPYAFNHPMSKPYPSDFVTF